MLSATRLADPDLDQPGDQDRFDLPRALAG
jgi:hypothetical protein